MENELTLFGQVSTGFLKQEIVIVSFFENEVVLNNVNKEKQKELIASARAQAKEQGNGFLKTIGAQMKAISNYTDKLSAMDKNTLKSLDNARSISKQEIKNIKFTNASEYYDEEQANTKIQGKLTITTTDKKIKIKHDYFDNKKTIKKYIKNYI